MKNLNFFKMDGIQGNDSIQSKPTQHSFSAKLVKYINLTLLAWKILIVKYMMTLTHFLRAI